MINAASAFVTTTGSVTCSSASDGAGNDDQGRHAEEEHHVDPGSGRSADGAQRTSTKITTYSTSARS